jgi:hypothetical protein
LVGGISAVIGGIPTKLGGIRIFPMLDLRFTSLSSLYQKSFKLTQKKDFL